MLHDVTFLHWPYDPERIRPLLPAGTEPDVFDGRAWIGVVGLAMEPVRALGLPVPPPVRRTTRSTQLNVRTYCVDSRGRRGLVFLSMETSRPSFGFAARLAGRLPYHSAAVAGRASDTEVEYSARRRGRRFRLGSSGRAASGVFPPIGMRFRVRLGDVVEPDPLDHFLTARWRLHNRWYGTTMRVPVRHEPWALRTGELVAFADGGLLTDAGLRPPDESAHVLYSPGTRVGLGLPAFL
ncbi:YqjF family protein [Saccharopolyspora erythraea]|nr:DUF2071 domain-containing protein [Saccharopolyspora erythraea]EQD83749.1 hypothetical protein N599_23655 [Saccharopolyspora erythraea D]QRK88484.1 DUF2071 domain-containing protein [Saccharopolyspora erythraea]